MFADKNEFKLEFEKKIIETYGRGIELSHRTERYMVLGNMIRDYASYHWKESKDIVARKQEKQVTYFSLEFLMGRLLTNNMMNLGIYNVVKDGLDELGLDLNEIEDMESDAGLGNGGLGRLAACFMDSLASLGIAGNGNCIRYEYGLFKQKIINGYQVEVPDQWLKLGNVWEVRKPKHAVDVKFWGNVELNRTEDGKIIAKHVNAEHISAIPYDMPIVGQNTTMTNTLRLWSAEASENLPNKDFRTYLYETNEICLNVYPDDSSEHGKYLRLKQQYFFVAAGLASLIKGHIRTYDTLDNFAKKNVLQLNDTHPVLAIPEFMRLLMDEHNYEWDAAWAIVSKSVAFTNHTVLQEALEKWPVEYVSKLLPRIYMIIDEINRRFLLDLNTKQIDPYKVRRMSIIKDGYVHMANLAIVAAFSVNGVAYLHTEILKNDVMKEFYEFFPYKFNNKTNGITHRRWLLYSNPQLVELLEETIGPEFKNDIFKLSDLMQYVDNRDVQNKFLKVKYERKVILAKYIKDTLGVEIDPDSIFDVQAKRLHAYKRQLLNCMHIMYLCNRIIEDPDFTMHPRTFIFSAKSAPAYSFAKAVIKLINCLQDKVNNEPRISKLIKVVFIPNYSVSIAEILMNASDVSEQISTAGKEASGTGNMKFMMNGALTLGTLDGANVEISEQVGLENCEIFGLHADEVSALRLDNSYNAYSYYDNDPRIKRIMDELNNTTLTTNPYEFKIIYEELIYHNDEYLLLADFDEYVKAQERVNKRYLDRNGWARMCLINIAKSCYFSSDRTIKEYADDIWHVNEIKM